MLCDYAWCAQNWGMLWCTRVGKKMKFSSFHSFSSIFFFLTNFPSRHPNQGPPKSNCTRENYVAFSSIWMEFEEFRSIFKGVGVEKPSKAYQYTYRRQVGWFPRGFDVLERELKSLRGAASFVHGPGAAPAAGSCSEEKSTLAINRHPLARPRSAVAEACASKQLHNIYSHLPYPSSGRRAAACTVA